jgi:3-hydroxyacyl-[acyl-carrier-protein] dehydratase
MTTRESTIAEGTRLDDLDVAGIMRRIPHRYPFLMIDRVVEMEAHRRAVGIKNVTANEPFFQGHFPGRPVMPGVLIVEAMAQAAGVLVCASCGADGASTLVYFTSIEQARFRRPVVPGDTLRLEMTKLASRLNIWKFKGEARVEDKVVAEAVISAMLQSE